MIRKLPIIENRQILYAELFIALAIVLTCLLILQLSRTLAGETKPNSSPTHPPEFNYKDKTPKPLKYKRSLHHYVISDIGLIGMDKKNYRLTHLLDQNLPVMLDFIFTTCPGICPMLSVTFAQVQKKLSENAEELNMVSISIDPEHDTPNKLMAYAKRFKAGPGWHFVTGNYREIEALQRTFDTFRGDKMSHPQLIFLRGQKNGPWLRIEGFASADDLIREYQALINK